MARTHSWRTRIKFAQDKDTTTRYGEFKKPMQPKARKRRRSVSDALFILILVWPKTTVRCKP